jgi:hypothetical protein
VSCGIVIGVPVFVLNWNGGRAAGTVEVATGAGGAGGGAQPAAMEATTKIPEAHFNCKFKFIFIFGILISPN